MEPVHQKQRQETLQHTHKHTHSGRKGVIAILWHWQLLGFSQFLSFFLSATNISSTSDSSWSWLSTYPDIYIQYQYIYIYIPCGVKDYTALMLMLTLLHLSAVRSTPCTCSNLQWLQAEHSLRCLGYTTELELVLCSWCGGEEVGSHEIRHEVLLIFAVLASVPVVDCSNKRFAVENLRSPETSILAVVGAVLLRFLYFLHPPLHLVLCKMFSWTFEGSRRFAGCSWASPSV